MTGWFDPSVLVLTAAKLMTANVFGRHSDKRLIEAMAGHPQPVFDDYEGEDGDFWIDYVADIGDGWNSTHAVAAGIATPELHGTQPGRVLVMGGDQVYPYPSRAAYERRAVAPYREAFARHGNRPDVFAIPGNHDWLDSLIAFTRLYCRGAPGFAGCPTRQSRSYFALQLPRDWWLLGVDLQLGADFDEPQLEYFKRVAGRMSDAARVILCLPEPQWLYEHMYPHYEAYSARTLDYFRREVIGHPMPVLLTGDLHFYMRHSNEAGEHRVVSGGGGAFLHPTHRPDVSRLVEASQDGKVDARHEFTERVTYPDHATSWRLAWRNLLLPLINPKFCVLAGVVYAMSAWFASSRLIAADLMSLPQAFRAALGISLRDPVCGLWLLLVVSGIVLFTDTHSRLYRLIGGAAHAIAHLATSLALAWLAARFTTDVLGMEYGEPLQLLIAGALAFATGGIAAGLVLGLYLLVSINLFGRHNTEAFSSLRIQDYKQWLRLRIDAAGGLTVWSLAIDRVPRRWRADATGAPVADDARATAPRVVDTFSVP
jgi:hypothetical protein